MLWVAVEVEPGMGLKIPPIRGDLRHRRTDGTGGLVRDPERGQEAPLEIEVAAARHRVSTTVLPVRTEGPVTVTLID